MTKSVCTQLAVFAGLMLILFGLEAGLGERYLEPTGISENAFSAERVPEGESAEGTDLSALSCGSAWAPYGAAPDEDDEDAGKTKSRLSQFGVNRCEALLAGAGVSAVLLTVSGAGIWLILLAGAYNRRMTARDRAEDEETTRLVERRRLESEQRRRERADRRDDPSSEQITQ